MARQVLNARHWDIQSAKNDALLRTADAYFMVHQYRGIYAGTLYTVERARDVVNRIATLSRDLVPAFEVDRARNMLADLSQQSVTARQQWRVQSARLTKVLRLDPRAVVEPLEHDHTQITLIDPARMLDDLMPIALTNRPEIASRRALDTGGGGGDPPGKGTSTPSHRAAQRLPDRGGHVVPGRDLRSGPQQQPQPVERAATTSASSSSGRPKAWDSATSLESRPSAVVSREPSSTSVMPRIW